ncbi:hypothetical protein ACTTAI_00205 (plasmid) [Rhodobacter capsulatus]|uniref:hypothetical protein n=1 Tax=Rhodobacter capsulatus TaxID=1061 RepID=UPI004029759D
MTGVDQCFGLFMELPEREAGQPPLLPVLEIEVPMRRDSAQIVPNPKPFLEGIRGAAVDTLSQLPGFETNLNSERRYLFR